MVFQLVLVSHSPPTASDDVDAVAAALLRDIGLLPGGLDVLPDSTRRRRGRPRGRAPTATGSADPPRPGEEVLASVPYRLLMDCFLRHPDQGFTVEELESRLGASRPTVYRHLQRLRDLDLLSIRDEDPDGSRRRSYCLRFGQPSKAWRFVEVNAECALDTLRRMVDGAWRDAQGRHGKGDNDAGLHLDRTSARVSFRLPLTELHPADPDAGEDARLLALLQAVDYITPWSAAAGGDEVRSSLAYRLFRECLLDRPDRSWTMRELTAVLDTSKPTLYRHLKKLEGLDLMERGLRGESPRSSKAFRIRYGNLSKAWNFTEEHAKRSLRAYRETVEHLEALLEEVR